VGHTAPALACPNTHTGGRPLSGKSNVSPPSRRERRAADRGARYDVARDERRARAAPTGRGGSSLINTRTMTVVGVLVGVLIVAVVAFNQLGGPATGTVTDPEVEFAAAIQDGSTLGSVDAPVTLEVWEDFQCPVCARYALDVEPEIVDRYVMTNQLRIVHNDMSFIGGFVGKAVDDPSNESTIAAMGASCASEQDRYWSFAHWAYASQQGENRGAFDRAGINRIAAAAGVDEAAFGACMDTPEPMAAVVGSTQLAADLTVSSTPTLRINGGELIRGLLSVDQLSGLLDRALAETPPAP
jgi:protein-disulfide isomerase